MLTFSDPAIILTIGQFVKLRLAFNPKLNEMELFNAPFQINFSVYNFQYINIAKMCTYTK